MRERPTLRVSLLLSRLEHLTRVDEDPVHLRSIRSGLANAAHARTRGTRRDASSDDDEEEMPGVQRDARHRIMPERTLRPGA